MKGLEQKLAKSEAKLENLTSTRTVVDDRFVSVSLKPKADKIYIPPFKRNHKKKIKKKLILPGWTKVKVLM